MAPGFRPMEFSIKFDAVKRNGQLYILKGHMLYFQNYIVFISLQIDLG